MPRNVVPTFFVAQTLFAGVIEGAMVGKYQVRTRTDLHAFRRDFNALLRQAIGLDEERLRIDDHAVTEHARLAAMHDARRQQVEHERLIPNLDRMARVVAALIACDDLELLSEQINNLAFAFIAPLGADYCDNF